MKKKIFPKAKKHLKGFLTDESGKITKKDALGISIGAAIIGAADNVSAAHTNNISTSQNPSSYDFYPSNAEVTPNQTQTNSYTIINSATCNHASGIVNGHYSNIPTVNVASENVDFTKTHANHGSHGSHGSCGRGCW